MSEVEIGGTEVRELDGYLVGPERVARNRARTEQLQAAGTPVRDGGNIHDDETAQKLGFRGGTVAGSIHLDQFPPVLTAAFGGQWFERGSVSLHFRNATVDAEAVIAMVGVPGPGATQVAARMERADGMAVADGTAGCVETEPPYLHAIDLRPSPPEELRLLAGVEAGQPLTERTFTVASADQVARLEAAPITEPLDLYTTSGRFGPPVVNPSQVVHVLRNGPHDFGAEVAQAVGLFGAIEIRFVDGPLLCDTPYRMSGEVAAVGASPKTEYVWYDSRATDEHGRVAATMRMQLRWMKASSPLYAGDG
jgi:hypothetical protein